MGNKIKDGATPLNLNIDKSVKDALAEYCKSHKLTLTRAVEDSIREITTERKKALPGSGCIVSNTTYQPTASMMTRSKSLREQFYEFILHYGASEDSVTAFFGLENSYYISVIAREKYERYSAPDQLLPCSMVNELAEFYEFFTTTFKQYLEPVTNNWERVGGPLVLRLGKAYSEWKTPDVNIIPIALPDGGIAYSEALPGETADDY